MSVAVALKVKLPVALGVPERTPALLRVMPGGKVPAALKVKTPVPPPALTVWL
jgi:hypothetical protein